MTINTKILQLAAQAHRDVDAYATADLLRDVAGEIDRLLAENARLQRIIDSRPAINAGLPQTYIDWSQSIYLMEATRTLETPQ